MHLPVPPLRHPRHPLARLASVLLGLALFGLLLFFGLLAAGVLLVGGGALLLWRCWMRARQPASARASHASRPQVLEGEFVVVHSERPTTH